MEKEYIIKIHPIKECPECHHTKLKYVTDDSEIVYCTKCGLIINEPDYKINTTTVQSTNQLYRTEKLILYPTDINDT